MAALLSQDMFCCGSAPENIFHDSAETEHLKESFCAKWINAARCYGLVGSSALGNHKITQRLYTTNLHSGISFALRGITARKELKGQVRQEKELKETAPLTPV